MSAGTGAERPWFARYPPGIPHTIDIPEVSLAGLLEESVRRWPDRDAVVYYGRRYRYRELWDLAGRAAAGFRSAGLTPGARVALYLPNCPLYPIAFYGALRAGLSVVQVSPLYQGQDLTHLLKDARPAAIVTLEILHPNLVAVAKEVELPLTFVARLRAFYPIPARWFVNRVLRRRGLPTAFPTGPSVRTLEELLGAVAGPDAPVDPARDVAVFQYTGGTTGTPKAARLTHRNLVANALQCRAWFAVQPAGTGVTLTAIPLFHVYGMTVGMTYPFSAGETVVLQNRPEVDELLRLVDRYHPSELPGVPALYQAINVHPKTPKHDLRSIKVCVSGSAPLPREVARRFEERTGGYLIEGYGLTEASPVTHANPIHGEVRGGSIGLPLPNTDQKVVDLETGTHELAVGEVGELCVAGPQVMAGYDHEPEETALVLRDGWLRTGDIARLDAEGYAYIVDRKKDLIDVGGLKVYPREVEEVLFQHPSVQEVAVAGVSDRSLGEVVEAYVVLREGRTATESELIQFVRARLAHYKAPRRVEFRTSLPRTPIQKVLRRTLRAETERALAAASSAPGSGGPGPSVGAPPGPR